MPDVWVCGFTDDVAESLKLKIDAVLQGLELGEDGITSIVSMRAESCDGKRTPKPYIRVCSTARGGALKIIIALKEADIAVDTEWLQLANFFPADKMKRE